MNQAYTTLTHSSFYDNVASQDNDIAVLDPGNLGDNPEEVQLVVKGKQCK